MGLTIHYSIALPGKTLLPEVRQKLGALRQVCLDLPLKDVGELIEFKGEECNFENRDREDPLRWFLCQADTTINFKYDRSGKPVLVQGWPDGSYGRAVLPEHIIGFSTWPGDGCEQANIGLCRFPKSVIVPNRWTGQRHRLTVGAGEKWSWTSFCKTQYANESGVENFLRCHLSVVAMLDAAKQLGFEVEAEDEGVYWEKRDIQSLAKEIGEWDAFIAAFGGALKDAVEANGMQIEAPITQRRNFEQLEASGQDKLPKGLSEALSKLVLTTASAPSHQ